jgi:hypothetical protein
MAPASHDDATAAARLGAALEMFDEGVAMMRLNLRREWQAVVAARSAVVAAR